jgi:hypothetical protein
MGERRSLGDEASPVPMRRIEILSEAGKDAIFSSATVTRISGILGIPVTSIEYRKPATIWTLETGTFRLNLTSPYPYPYNLQVDAQRAQVEFWRSPRTTNRAEEWHAHSLIGITRIEISSEVQDQDTVRFVQEDQTHMLSFQVFRNGSTRIWCEVKLHQGE